MKLEIFDLKSIQHFANHMLNVTNMQNKKEDDFITEMLAQKLSRVEALNLFKETCMVYSVYIKLCLIKEDYATADKFKKIIKKEFNNTINIIDAIGELGDDDEIILNQIITEVNYINITNV